MATNINSTFQSSVTDSNDLLSRSLLLHLYFFAVKKQVSTLVMLSSVQSVRSITKHRTEQVLTGRDLPSNLCSLQTYDSKSIRNLLSLC